MSARPDDDVPVMIGYVEAWRWWEPVLKSVRKITSTRISFKLMQTLRESGPDTIDTGNGYQLESTGVDYVWEDGENSIDNYAGEYKKYNRLSLTSDHGFHAFKPDSIQNLDESVFGRVALYGDVVEHEYGYRAEKARILDLWCAPDLWEQMKDVPRMRGTFTIETDADVQSQIVDKDGNPYLTKGEEYILCHLSESRKESLAGNRLDSLTKLKILKPPSTLRNVYLSIFQSQFPLTMSMSGFVPLPSVSTLVGDDGKFLDSMLYAPEHPRPVVIKPEGDYCPICACRILDSDAIVVNYELPAGYMEKIADGEFKWVECKTHWECECASVAGCIDWTTMWSTAADTAWATAADPSALPQKISYTYVADPETYTPISLEAMADMVSMSMTNDAVRNLYSYGIDYGIDYIYPTYGGISRSPNPGINMLLPPESV